MSKQHISGILSQYVGKRDELIADLSVYLDSPVGVGEHGDIGSVIREKLIEIDKTDSIIDTINKYFSSKNTASSDDTKD